MQGDVQDIASAANGNDDFRRVFYTARADADADTEHFDGNTSEQG